MKKQTFPALEPHGVDVMDVTFPGYQDSYSFDIGPVAGSGESDGAAEDDTTSEVSKSA